MFMGLTSVDAIKLQERTIDDQRKSAIAPYQHGDYDAAERALREFLKQHNKDIAAWHYLGGTYEKLGKPREAIKAHEKAAKLGEWLLTKRLENSVGLNYLEEAQSIGNVLGLAGISCERYLFLSNHSSREVLNEWAERIEYLNDFASSTRSNKDSIGKVYSGKEAVKARIISKPNLLTKGARQNKVRGRVVLRAVFASDGHVRAIAPIQSLPRPDWELPSCSPIVFQPALLDGKPVTFVTLEYN
jgi:tetratricopeptide (TPR) repeat protein